MFFTILKLLSPSASYATSKRMGRVLGEHPSTVKVSNGIMIPLSTKSEFLAISEGSTYGDV
jgi:hypothetical protein